MCGVCGVYVVVAVCVWMVLRVCCVRVLCVCCLRVACRLCVCCVCVVCVLCVCSVGCLCCVCVLCLCCVCVIFFGIHMALSYNPHTKPPPDMRHRHAATGALHARRHFAGGGLQANDNLRRGKQFPACCCGYLLGPTKIIMSTCVVTPSGHEELMRVNDRRRFYANLSPCALISTCIVLTGGTDGAN